MKKHWITAPLTIVLLLLSTLGVQAGGWTVVTLDQLPHQLQAGQTITLGFTVRQHGIEPVNLNNVRLRATPVKGGETLVFSAAQQGAKGHYQVEVTLPSTGEWAWEIQPDGFPVAALAAITVVPAAEGGQPSAWQRWVLRGLRALPVNRAPILVGGTHAVLVMATFDWQTGQPMAAPAPADQEVSYGSALFAAKGCTSCHLHGAVNSGWSTEVGPNLTNYANSAEYLRRWLKDPQAMKPQTTMPNLALQSSEIEALAAFLTQPGQ